MYFTYYLSHYIHELRNAIETLWIYKDLLPFGTILYKSFICLLYCKGDALKRSVISVRENSNATNMPPRIVLFTLNHKKSALTWKVDNVHVTYLYFVHKIYLDICGMLLTYLLCVTFLRFLVNFTQLVNETKHVPRSSNGQDPTFTAVVTQVRLLAVVQFCLPVK